MKKLSLAAILIIIAAFVSIRASDAPHIPLENYPPNWVYNDIFPQGINDGYRSMLSAQLTQFQEPCLYRMPDCGRVVYRAMLLDSFSNSISIRVEIDRADRSGVLYYKNIKKEDLLDHKTIILTPKQVSDILKLMSAQSFWSLPSTGSNSGLDGWDWVIEGAEHGKYHVAIRWCPHDDPVLNIGVTFMELADPDYSQWLVQN